MNSSDHKIENKTAESPFNTLELNPHPMDKDKKILFSAHKKEQI